jgi:hypothetical protein
VNEAIAYLKKLVVQTLLESKGSTKYTYGCSIISAVAFRVKEDKCTWSDADIIIDFKAVISF